MRSKVWTGGHDNKVNALDLAGKMLYQIGDVDDAGAVSQPGGTKAIIRCGWNVWIFGARVINIYSAHCTGQAVARQVSSRSGARSRPGRPHVTALQGCRTTPTPD